MGWPHRHNSPGGRHSDPDRRVASATSPQEEMTTVLASSSAPELIAELEAGNARVSTWPTPAVSEPDDPAPLNNAIEDLFGYDWLLLKNETAARSFLRRFLEGHHAEELDDLRILTIGK